MSAHATNINRDAPGEGPEPTLQSTGTKAPLVITYRRTADLNPYSGNARTHSRAQKRKLAKSIRSFGFVNPILIDSTDTIIAGHARFAAALLLKLEQVPTIRLEALTPDQVRAYVIADNRLAEDAGWDEQILKVELQALVLNDHIDISLTGFEISEIDIRIGENAVEHDLADDLPEEQAQVVTRIGDIWKLREHRTICGDARAAAAFETLMNGRQAALTFCDIPYNLKIEGNVSGKGVVKHSNFAMATGEMSEAEFTQFMEITFGHLAHHSTNGSVHFICMDWRHLRELLDAGSSIYSDLLNMCVWVKDNGGQGSLYRSQHELIFVFRNGKGKHQNNIQLGRFGRYRTNVWKYPGVRGLSQQQGEEGNLLALHPTVKPVALIADAILDCSVPGDLVLDSFLGSGSTLIAAERVRRTCYGMEIEPRYVDTAVRRWQTYTGENALHAATGQTFTELSIETSHHG
jgi:DNA modification methylase